MLWLEDNCSSLSDDNTLEISVTNSDLLMDSKEDVKLPKMKKQVKDAKQGLTKRHRVVGENASTSGEVSTKDCVDNTAAAKDISESNIAEAVGEAALGTGETKGKTMWEILELEMRARAIRALLERADAPQTDASTAQPVKENPADISETKNNVTQPKPLLDAVDLTVDDPVDKESTLIDKEKANENNGESVTLVVDVVDTSQSIVSNNEASENISVDDKCKVSADDDCKQNTNELDTGIVTLTEKSDVDESCSNTWAQRWLDKKSKDVKRLVSTSKMCTTIRNKMKLKRITTIMTSPATNELNDVKLDTPIEFKGSIEEYKMLIGKQEESQQAPLKTDSTDDGENDNGNNSVENTTDEINETVTENEKVTVETGIDALNASNC